MTDATVVLDANVEKSCLRNLQEKAVKCLETFPRKVIELNELVDEYKPQSIKNVSKEQSLVNLLSKSQSTVSSFVRDSELTTSAGLDLTSYYSLSMYDRGRTARGIYKRRYYRLYGSSGCSARRRPGPLGQILTFIASRFAICTKKIVITPSRFIVDSIVSMFFQRRELKNVQCGTSLDWDNCLSDYVTTFKKDSSLIGSFINVMRPAAVQLIADTTVLKRWLQALALSTIVPHPTELISAAKNTETIDCWAYELFFHLKQLQTGRTRQNQDEANTEDGKIKDEIAHTNLWHRLVQLRDNYIILYEILHENRRILELIGPKKKPK